MNEGKVSKPRFFIKSSILEGDRIDCQYYDPKYFDTVRSLERITKETSDFELISLENALDEEAGLSLTGGETPLGAVYLSDGIPFVRVQNVKETGIDLSDAVFISETTHNGKLKRSQLHPGDVLLTITGTYGISGVVPNSMTKGNINQHVVRITIDKQRILPEYLALYLNSEYAKIQMDRAATGATRFALDYDAIKKILLLRPDIRTQARIVKEIRRIHDEAEVIKKQIDVLESSYDSIVLTNLGIDLPKEPKLKTFLTSVEKYDRLEVKWHYPYYDEIMKIISSYRSKRLIDYKQKLKYGASIDADYDSDIPFLRIENLRRNFIDTSDLQYIPSGGYKDEIRNLYLQKDDILIERSGTYVGLASLVPENMERYVYGSYIIRLRLEDKEILPAYLSAYLNSTLGRIQFDRLKTGSLQFNLNTQQIRDVLVIQPDKDIQKQISDTIFKTINYVAELKQQYKQKLEYAKDRYTGMLR